MFFVASLGNSLKIGGGAVTCGAVVIVIVNWRVCGAGGDIRNSVQCVVRRERVSEFDIAY